MRRRHLLGVLGGGLSLLAGCQAFGQPTDPPTPTPTTTPTGASTTTETPTRSTCDAPGNRRIELAATKEVPADADFSMTAAMDREQVTADAPARVRIQLTSQSDDLQTNIQDTEYCSFVGAKGDAWRRSDPPGLWLHRQRDSPANRAGECWTRDQSPVKTRTVEGLGCEAYTLGTGESVTTTYEVWDDYRAEGYFQPDTYRFRFQVPMRPSETDGNPSESVTWWFDLHVTAGKP